MKGLKIVLVTAMILTGVTLTAQAGSMDDVFIKVQKLLGSSGNEIQTAQEPQDISIPQQPLGEPQSLEIKTDLPVAPDLSSSKIKISDITTGISDITIGNSSVTESKSSVTTRISDITIGNPIEIPDINIRDNLFGR